MKVLIILLFCFCYLFSQTDSVKVYLNWKHQFQFAGFYIAKEKGLYKKAGLDVEIIEYEYGTDIEKEVLESEGVYGVGRSSLLISRANGAKLVALLANFQSSPLVLITTNPTVEKVEDLLGKKMMITVDAISSASILAMLHSHGVREDYVELQQHSFRYQDLVTQSTDAMGSYTTNEPFFLEQENVAYKIFDPKDYGYDFYGDILFTSEKELYSNTKRTKAFREATRDGWLWAFENIEESAKLIHEKYNTTQKKSLESLVYEGKKLKELAFQKDFFYGHLCIKKFAKIQDVFYDSGYIDEKQELQAFLNPLKFGKQKVNIGVLALRGKESSYKKWSEVVEYLNYYLDQQHYVLKPLDFEGLEQAISQKSVDFVLTNSMFYVQMEELYKLSRIATLLEKDMDGVSRLKSFGSTIIAKAENKEINEIKDLENKHIGAVNQRSFGGWMMGKELLFDHQIYDGDYKISFLGTHDNVIEKVLSGEIDAGIVRTGILEKMEAENKLQATTLKVLAPKRYEGFPFQVSSKLYPEWPMAKMPHVDDDIADALLSVLLSNKYETSNGADSIDFHWSTPREYTAVSDLLKKLEVYPYDDRTITLEDIYEKYGIYINFFFIVLSLSLMRNLYLRYKQKLLKEYSNKLDIEVQEKTTELLHANKRLKELAHLDSLTQIANRGYFLKLANKYFKIAKRNDANLLVLSLDIDHFKEVNDTYGHQAGDDVLKAFSANITNHLRDSDLFGRIGGEEFCVVLQNTDLDGAKEFSARILVSTQAMKIMFEEQLIQITVSIGITLLHEDDKEFKQIMKRSDEALYEAKESGRNKMCIVF